METRGGAFPVHYAWLGSGRWGVEAVANLDVVPAKGAILVLGGPKVRGLQFGHFEKVTPGKIQDFSLGEIFCWSRNFVRCNDFRKWSHYLFRAAR